MTPEERQRLSQFARDNNLCVTVDGGQIVDISDNEPWSNREEALSYPVILRSDAYPILLDVAECWSGRPSQYADQDQPRQKPKTMRRRKANKAARKARRNRR